MFAKHFLTGRSTDIFLKNYLTANPSKSMYGFTLNRKRPGHFNLCFLANKNSTVQTWVSFLSLRICWSVCSSRHSPFELLQRLTTSSMLLQLEYPSYAMHSKSGIYTSLRISLQQLQVGRHLLGPACAHLQDQEARPQDTCPFVKWDEHPIRM